MRSYLLVSAALLAVAAPLAAQDTLAAQRETDVTILDITVDPAANERHVVFLQKRVVYRARFGGPGITIRMRSIGNRPLPFIVNATAMADATGATEYELYPAADGEIELTPVGNQDQVPVRFLLWKDARATERGSRAAQEGWWDIGLEFGIGRHFGDRSEGAILMAGGSTYTACFSFRNGPGLAGRLNGCALGLEINRSDDDVSGLDQAFIEPRIRVVGDSSRHQGWGWDAGLVTHIGFSERDNVVLGLGAYAATDLRAGDRGQGIRLLLQARQDWVDENASRLSSRLTLGYYW